MKWIANLSGVGQLKPIGDGCRPVEYSLSVFERNGVQTCSGVLVVEQQDRDGDALPLGFAEFSLQTGEGIPMIVNKYDDDTSLAEVLVPGGMTDIIRPKAQAPL